MTRSPPPSRQVFPTRVGMNHSRRARDEARQWVLSFTRWYNHEHKHRNLKFVSPAQRHRGDDQAIFAQRIALYEWARAKHPARWSRGIRNWSLPAEVWLNRATEERVLREAA